MEDETKLVERLKNESVEINDLLLATLTDLQQVIDSLRPFATSESLQKFGLWSQVYHKCNGDKHRLSVVVKFFEGDIRSVSHLVRSARLRVGWEPEQAAHAEIGKIATSIKEQLEYFLWPDDSRDMGPGFIDWHDSSVVESLEGTLTEPLHARIDRCEELFRFLSKPVLNRLGELVPRMHAELELTLRCLKTSRKNRLDQIDFRDLHERPDAPIDHEASRQTFSTMELVRLSGLSPRTIQEYCKKTGEKHPSFSERRKGRGNSQLSVEDVRMLCETIETSTAQEHTKNKASKLLQRVTESAAKPQ